MTETVARPYYQVIVIGAGLTGLNTVYKARELGLTVRCFEAGSGVGGTWFWNRYPGARLDSESYTYVFDFDEGILADWTWTERFAQQPEVEAYLNFAADRLDLKKDIQFNSRVRSATWREDENLWDVELEDGSVARCQFLVTSVGFLSAPNWPRTTGLDDFRGEHYHTGLWPNHQVDLAGKRVAVIGTGASGVQIIQTIAPEVASMTVYQRTPNWCSPVGDLTLSAEEMAAIKRDYPQLLEFLRNTVSGFLHTTDPRSALEVDDEERTAKFEELWAKPGMAKWMANFSDIAMNEQANAYWCAFVEAKIRARVKDQSIADVLIPTDHGFGQKRPPLEINYYEVYNQENVDLVDLRVNPIERFTESGILTADGQEREFDVIVFATGFDAYTGALTRIDFRGRDGVTLKDYWADGPRTNWGIQVYGFPNLFIEVGPHNKGGFCNVPRCSEQNVDFVTRTLAKLAESEAVLMETSLEGEEAWIAHVNEGAARTLLPKADSFLMGSNVEGKARAFVGYIGALPDVTRRAEELADAGYPGFLILGSDGNPVRLAT